MLTLNSSGCSHQYCREALKSPTFPLNIMVSSVRGEVKVVMNNYFSYEPEYMSVECMIVI